MEENLTLRNCPLCGAADIKSIGGESVEYIRLDSNETYSYECSKCSKIKITKEEIGRAHV